MSKQPEALALRLADWLESEDMPTDIASCADAADELRRLVAENEEYMRDMQLTNEIAAEALFRASKAEAQRDELLTTLKKLEYSSDGYIKRYPEEAEVNAVIAKAEGKQ